MISNHQWQQQDPCNQQDVYHQQDMYIYHQQDVYHQQDTYHQQDLYYVHKELLSSADSSEDAPPPVQPPSANRSTPLATYRQLGKRSRAWEDDEEERKRRKEAEEMAKSLSRPKSVACGVGYNGDQEEKRYSDDAKDKIKKRLPALKNNMLLFHYMVWSTLERLDCNHCRKCPNEFQP